MVWQTNEYGCYTNSEKYVLLIEDKILTRLGLKIHYWKDL